MNQQEMLLYIHNQRGFFNRKKLIFEVKDDETRLF